MLIASFCSRAELNRDWASSVIGMLKFSEVIMMNHSKIFWHNQRQGLRNRRYTFDRRIKMNQNFIEKI